MKIICFSLLLTFISCKTRVETGDIKSAAKVSGSGALKRIAAYNLEGDTLVRRSCRGADELANRKTACEITGIASWSDVTSVLKMKNVSDQQIQFLTDFYKTPTSPTSTSGPGSGDNDLASNDLAFSTAGIADLLLNGATPRQAYATSQQSDMTQSASIQQKSFVPPKDLDEIKERSYYTCEYKTVGSKDRQGWFYRGKKSIAWSQVKAQCISWSWWYNTCTKYQALEISFDGKCDIRDHFSTDEMFIY